VGGAGGVAMSGQSVRYRRERLQALLAYMRETECVIAWLAEIATRASTEKEYANNRSTDRPEIIEEVAKIIDPEAFGLPTPDRGYNAWKAVSASAAAETAFLCCSKLKTDFFVSLLSNDYIAYIKRNQDFIDTYINLDVSLPG
jgi:hypothetical protein